jgi:regulator of replication initiation timing
MAKTRMTKAEIERDNAELADICSMKEAEIGALKSQVAGLQHEIRELREEMKEKQLVSAELRFGLGGEEREPETEVGYLRRELAYARGQLHQSHLTVKQLCGRITMARESDHPAHQGATYKAILDGNDLDAIHNLNNAVRVLLAELINKQDLATAGLDRKGG